MPTSSVRDRAQGGLAWREAGTGDVALFLHGLGGSRTAWEPQLLALSDVRRCVAWDMPGYGESAPHRDLSFETIADAVCDLVDVLGVDSVDVVGLSFGGMHALHAVLRHPGRFRSMVLADTSAVFGGDGTDAAEWIAGRTASLDDGNTPADIAGAVLRAIAAPGFDGANLAMAEAAFSRITSDGLRAACRCLVTHDVRDRLGEISMPTLVVVGELDQETPPAYSEELAAGIAGSTLRVIEGAGHLTPAEAPQRFNELVRTFWCTTGSLQTTATERNGHR
jgi:pimeloyl-ACP methyl ester carboxylesterase